MELRSFNKDKGPLLAAVVALLILGAGSVFLTWQNIRRQRELVDQHLLLSAGAVLHGVEANLMRIMHGMGRSPDLAHRLFPTIKEFFQEITASGDIVFLGVFGEDGSLVVSSAKEDTPVAIALPEQIVAELEIKGHWEGPLQYRGKTALFAALRARPSLSRICSDVVQGVPILPKELSPRGQAPGRGQGRGLGRGLGADPRAGMGPGMGPGMGRGMMAPPPDEAGPARQPDVPSMFLVAALSPAKHLAQFDAYRRAALLQTGYVLGAAAVLWFLALAYLSRRNQALKAARLERFHSKLLDNMPDGLLTLGPGGIILSANGSAARLLMGDKGGDKNNDKATDRRGGDGGADLTGRSFLEFPFAGMAATDGSRPDEWRQYEHDGRILEVLCLPLQAVDNSEVPADQAEEKLVLLRDRTRMKSLEDDLAEAKRLATIGSLAAGVAHEIRNPLSSLRGFAQLFATKLKGQEPLSSYACTMVQEADRLNRVVTDLLYLARPRELTPDPVDLVQVVESLQGLLRFDLEAKGVKPRLDLAETHLCADEDGLKQALLNLMVNALDALPEAQPEGGGGGITLSSRSASPADGGDGPGVWISVADTGQGMDEEVRSQAFEPFFTAKRQGTGLGLAIVQGIMRAHKGRALIDSTPGQGTTVHLFFPDCPESADKSADKNAAENARVISGPDDGGGAT